MSAHVSAFLLGLLPWGMNLPDLGALILRLGIGVPFFISGMNKMLCPTCHGWLRSNLTRSGIPCVGFTVWWLAAWEAVAGLTLALGLMSAASAFVLLIICIVAWLVSWKRKLEAKKPAHKWDAATEVLFCFDVLLIWMLLSLMFTGPGAVSLDRILFPSLMPA